MTYHMTKYMIMGVILFLLVYGKKAILPINESYDLYMKNCIMQIMEEVLYIRKETWHMIWHSQQCIMKNNRKKEKLFQIRERST